jgi:hypothetical protein
VADTFAECILIARPLVRKLTLPFVIVSQLMVVRNKRDLAFRKETACQDLSKIFLICFMIFFMYLVHSQNELAFYW